MGQTIKTEFTEQFDVRYPIIAAPMFLVSNEAMVIATTKSGGMGTFPALNFRPLERYREAIQNIKKQTTGPFAINIIVQKSNKTQNDHVQIALEEKVPLLITSLGNPKEVIRLAHEVGTKVYCDVVGLEHAKKVADLGADGIIAVGSGAGGHAGTISPFALIPYLRAHIRLPIIAAGSIVDGKGMAAAFALGASAIYMGTRFIASKESTVSEEYKSAILSADCEDIVNTDKVDGFAGNFIRTKNLENLGLEPSLLEKIISHSKRAKRSIAMLRAARALFGNPKGKASYKTIFSAGHGVSGIHSVQSIAEIIESTMAEYARVKSELP